ncbi:hypothetical protein BsWGS_14931 [Bradybaena similaris]
MKPKGPHATRSRTPKGKLVKKEQPSEETINMPSVYNVQPSLRPSVEIVKCISFQKFRYSGENRPGKKYQEKEFMTLKLSNLQDKVVRVVIICTDADNRELIHPNGLVGKDCHDGIYDKEYAVTKQFFHIKIPYLRTERMKTKKNEHKNILGVLSARASHLPSPYKERCLSQCTDKYTTAREKFDTTKVCLGVIVTVESHPGILNGSLHAISHVVRNASEKTSLSIFKLSNDSVPALTGACIDIFTSEDGPAIEPDKYLVHVSYDSEVSGVDSWESEKYSPGKADLLYKRVITYKVPPFKPHPSIHSPVPVTLHLECPQSNQYCSCQFQYIPQGDVILVDDQPFGRGQKRDSIEHDIKPSPKRLRSEMYDNDGSTEAIKANLKTKIKARNEAPNNIEAVCIDSQGDYPEQEESRNFIREHKQLQMYSQECPVIIHHHDLQTGESYHLLDMDASKSSNNNGAALVGSGNQYVIHFQDKGHTNIMQGLKSAKVPGSVMQSDPQGLKVVATGYSDTPNTVLIYTSSEILSERVGDSAVEHLIHRVPDENQMVFTDSPSFRQAEKHVSVFPNDGLSTSSMHKTASQIMRGEAVADKRPSYINTFVGSGGQLEGTQSISDHSVSAAENRLVSTVSYASNNSASTSSSISSHAERYSPSQNPFPSSIPPIRRMLIPSKAVSSASPWEVDNGDDSSSDYNIVFKTFEASNNRVSFQPVALKSEPLDEDPYRQRNEFSLSRTSMPSYHVPLVPISEPQYQHLGRNNYNKESENREDIHTTSGETTVKAREDSAAAPQCLNSLDVAEAIVNNLPTMKILEIATQLQNDNSSGAEEATESS